MSQEKLISEDEVSLLEAAKKGLKDVCEKLIQKGVSIQCQDAFGRTPLYLAAINNHASTLAFLLSQGATYDIRRDNTSISINECFAHSRMQLNHTAQSMHPITLKYLSGKGSRTQICRTVESDLSVLHAAAYYDAIETFKLLLAVDELGLIESRGMENNTPLLSAALGNSPRVASYLLDRQARVDVVNDKDMTLLIAVIHGSDVHKKKDIAEILSILSKAGVNVNHQQTLHSQDSALVAATSRVNHKAVSVLLENNADINQVAGRHQASPLHWAAIWGDFDMVKLLVEKGADVNLACDFYGTKNSTPLFHVITGSSISKQIFPVRIPERLEIIDFLIRSGANINHITGDHLNALGVSAFLGQVDIVNVLLSLGALTDITCAYEDTQKTPYEIALAKGHSGVVEAIKMHKASIDYKILANTQKLGTTLQTLVSKIAELEKMVAYLRRQSSETDKQILALRKQISGDQILLSPRAMGIFHRGVSQVNDTPQLSRDSNKEESQPSGFDPE